MRTPKNINFSDIKDKIVISWFRNILYKTLKEKFDLDEVKEYFEMSVEDYNSNNLSLSTEDTIKCLVEPRPCFVA